MKATFPPRMGNGFDASLSRRKREPARRRYQSGQSLIESVVVIPIFGAFLLGVFQAVLFYRAKAVVDYAALQAARRGATHFAQKSAMCKGLAAGLTPLYTHEPNAAGALAGYGKARLNVCAMPGATIQIISPTRAMFDAWKEKQYDGVAAIPNDSLMFRGDEVREGVTVQDANLLKIRVTYKFPLIVPVIDKLIGNGYTTRCNEDGCQMFESLDIVSQATVRMQTPIRDRNLLADAGSGGGSSGTGGGTGGSGGSGTGSGGGTPGNGGGGGNQPPNHT